MKLLMTKNTEISEILKFMRDSFARLQTHYVENDASKSRMFGEEWERLNYVFLLYFVQIRCYLFLFRNVQPDSFERPVDLLTLWLNKDGSQMNFEHKRHRLDQNYSISIQRGFLVEFVWHVEYLLKSISSKLNSVEKFNGYKKYVDFITDNLDFEDPVQIRHSLLAISYVRNSLHLGVYNGKTTHVILRGRRYDFVKGVEDEWMKWEHLFVFVSECIKALEKINAKIDPNFV